MPGDAGLSSRWRVQTQLVSLPLIGDFARATHLSVKTLRYYHDAHLLVPAEIDPHSATGVTTSARYPYCSGHPALWRILERPLTMSAPVLQDPPILGHRNVLIGRHRGCLEDELGKTQVAVAALRDLLDHPSAERHLSSVAPCRDVGRCDQRRGRVGDADFFFWLQGALGELYATVLPRVSAPSGRRWRVIACGGPLRWDEVRARDRVSSHHGAVIVPTRQSQPIPEPPSRLSRWSFHTTARRTGFHRAYGVAGVLCVHVMRSVVPGPVREFYPVNRHHRRRPSTGAPRSAGPSSPPAHGPTDLTASAEPVSQKRRLSRIHRVPARHADQRRSPRDRVWLDLQIASPLFLSGTHDTDPEVPLVA